MAGTRVVAVVTGGAMFEQVPLADGTRNTLETAAAVKPVPLTVTVAAADSAAMLAGEKPVTTAKGDHTS